jgi:hypothetical protein
VKKLISVYLVFFCCSFFVHAQSEEAGGSDSSDEVTESQQAVADIAEDTASAEGEESEATDDETPTLAEGDDEEPAEAETAEEDAESEKKRKWDAFFRGEGAALSTGKRESRRYFELGLLNLDFGLVGLDMSQLFSGSFLDDSLDVEKMSSFTSDIRLFTNPVYVKFPIRNLFTMDVFTGAQMNVYFDLPQKTVDSLKRIMDLADNSDSAALQDYIRTLDSIDAGMTAGAAAFIELGVGGSKTLLNDRLWVRAAPSLFFTLFYMQNENINFRGHSDTVNNIYGLIGSGEMDLYSAWDLDEDPNPFASPGFDLTLEARYALWSVLDVGLNVSHIPIAPSTLTHRTTINADQISMTVDASDYKNEIDITIPEMDDLLTGSESEKKMVLRPVRFDFYTLYKPFKSPVLIVKPNIGATVNSTAGSLFNVGLNVEYNAPRIFSAYIGTGLNEGLWAHHIGIALDLRLFEVDLGAGLAGADFAGSFSGQNGMMVRLCFKTGF